MNDKAIKTYMAFLIIYTIVSNPHVQSKHSICQRVHECMNKFAESLFASSRDQKATEDIARDLTNLLNNEAFREFLSVVIPNVDRSERDMSSVQKEGTDESSIDAEALRTSFRKEFQSRNYPSYIITAQSIIGMLMEDSSKITSHSDASPGPQPSSSSSSAAPPSLSSFRF